MVQIYSKTNTKQQFSKAFLFAIIAPWDGFWRQFWLILGRVWAQNGLDQFWYAFWSQKLLQKVTKNGTTFGTALRQLSRVSRSRFQELYERCGKAIGIGIIFSKEEGGIENVVARGPAGT